MTARIKNKVRIAVLEEAWEIFIDQLNDLRDTFSHFRSEARERENSMARDIDILRTEVLKLQNKRDPLAEATNQETLDGVPEFETVEEAEEYARAELAKGGRAETIRRWINDPNGYNQENDDE
jgi:t-SNARE complex subunit (syntaxin)